MRFSIVCFLVGALSKEIRATIFGKVIPPQVEWVDGVETFWFRQILDHSSNGTPTYWFQRYLVNSKPQNTSVTDFPVFLMVGGEDRASEGWMTSGSWVNWAYRYGALLLQLEHRFYGDSHPTPDASVESLQYLTSEQALGDIKYFIEQMIISYNLTSSNKWILFAGSYPGSLVAWARLKLPDLVYGAVSSSAPLQATIDFYQYREVVATSLDTFSPGCAQQFTSAIKTIQSMLESSSGTQDLIDKFNICDDFNVTEANDLAMFYVSLFSAVGSAVQYNNLGNSSQKISFVCGILNDDSTSDPVDRLALLYNVTDYSHDCLYATYEGNIKFYQASNWNDSSVSEYTKQWLYQTCNEFGFFQTSETNDSLESDTLPLSFFTQQCTDIFGSNYNYNQLNQSVAFTNQNYGGTDIKVDRVVFVQGTIDPWHALGMLKNPTPESPFILINGTAHCQDMMSPNASADSKELTDARNEIQSYLDKWLM